jgi:hypothetical protein
MNQSSKNEKKNEPNNEIKNEKIVFIEKPELKSQIEETLIQMLMRQTTYTREESIVSFEKNKTIDKCIEEYLGVSKKNNSENITTNQAIFKTIRDFFN